MYMYNPAVLRMYSIVCKAGHESNRSHKM